MLSSSKPIVMLSLVAIVLLTFTETTLSFPLIDLSSHAEDNSSATPDPDGSPDLSTATKIAPSVVVVVVVLAGVAIAVWYWRKRRHQVFVEAVMNDGQQPEQRFNESN